MSPLNKCTYSTPLDANDLIRRLWLIEDDSVPTALRKTRFDADNVPSALIIPAQEDIFLQLITHVRHTTLILLVLLLLHKFRTEA